MDNEKNENILVSAEAELFLVSTDGTHWLKLGLEQGKKYAIVVCLQDEQRIESEIMDPQHVSISDV